jgi:hypothetical protein
MTTSLTVKIQGYVQSLLIAVSLAYEKLVENLRNFRTSINRYVRVGEATGHTQMCKRIWKDQRMNDAGIVDAVKGFIIVCFMMLIGCIILSAGVAAMPTMAANDSFYTLFTSIKSMIVSGYGLLIVVIIIIAAGVLFYAFGGWGKSN